MPDQSMSQFLQANKYDRHWRGGVICSVCRHKQVKKINEDLREFARAKLAGHAMPWAVFQRKRLIPLYDLRVGVNSILKHVRTCLEIDGT